MRWRAFLSRLCLLLLVGLPLAVRTDTPPTVHDYSVDSQDGRYIYVMLTEAPYGIKDPGLRKKYTRSGLYAADDPPAPLWTVDWYSPNIPWQTIYIASDGVHMTRLGEWPRKGDYGTLAVAFYANGKQLEAYSVADLAAAPEELLESTSHYMWLESAQLNDAANQFELVMLGGERYTFDLARGAIVDQDTPGLTPTGRSLMLVGGATLALLGVGAYAYRRRVDRKR
jgi:hypothetical protein